jgi:tetratricopeptide (TPR) repeat protein
LRRELFFLPSFAFLFAIFASGQVSQPDARFHFTEQPGPFAVGLRVIEQYDYSRTYLAATSDLGKPATEERARPIQTLVWYPAIPSSMKRMTVGDYAQLLSTETAFDRPKLSFGWEDWVKGMAPSLKDPMWSVREAPPAAGHFPVVIYAPSFSAMSWENADLCEYLASHGYLVLASPDMGANTRGMTSDVSGIEAQARDISFLISYARTLPNADMTEVAVAGFSWGGISNLFAAARDNRISALVALDGSMRYYPGLVKQSGYVHPEEMTLPLLYFTQGEITVEDQSRFFSSKDNEGPNVLNAWTHGDLLTVHDLALVHVEHSSMYQRNETTWAGYAKDHKGDYSRSDGIIGYGWVARYTLHFLDAYLKHDASALSWLQQTPSQNGVPPHLMATDFRPAKGAPVSYEAFRGEVGKQGFDHAADIYAAMLKSKSDFKIAQESLEDWSTRLVDDEHLPEAIAILKLTVQIYPESGGDFEDLGEVYVKSGQKKLAIEALQKALQLDPDNAEVQAKLKELQVATEVVH